MRRGPLEAGEKVQFTDRRSNKFTDQLVPGGVTQTSHGIILHDEVIGRTEGSVIVTVSAKREAQINQDHPERDANKPWKGTRAIGGWEFAVMRPRLADYVLSMPRGAQIMYPKDIAQVIQLGDIRSGMNVLESGAGSGAMSINLLDAVGEGGRLTHRDAFGIRACGRSQCHDLFRRPPCMVGSENRRFRFGCGRTAGAFLRPHHARYARPVEPARTGIPRDSTRGCARGIRDHHYATEPYGRGIT